MSDASDRLELAVYRLITPPWLYFALLKEYRTKWGKSPYTNAKKILAACSVLGLSGCASGGLLTMSDAWCAEHPDASYARCYKPLPSESWDQANLKQNDNTCRTMVYIAPGGDLEQCP